MDAVTEPYEYVKRQMVFNNRFVGLRLRSLRFVQVAGTAIPSFCSRNLEDSDQSPDHEDCVQYGAMAMYTGVC